MSIPATSIALLSLTSSSAVAQTGPDFAPTTFLVRSNVSDLVAITQVVGTPTADIVARNGFDLLIFDGDFPASPQVATIAGTEYQTDVQVLGIEGGGDMDIVESRANMSVRVHVQSAGTFSTQTYSLAISGQGKLRAGDLDADGLIDLSFGRAILLAGANGAFLVVPFTLDPAGSTNLDLLVADLDGDGDEDILSLYVLPGQTAVTSPILRRNANGSLDPRIPQTFVAQSEILIESR